MVLAHDIEGISRTDDIKILQNITFEYMLLSKRTLDGLKQAGFYKPSPIQLHGIPLGKCGFDLLLEAKSGTGKTAVFSVIALEKIVINNGLQVLILAPTREIAAQIHDVLKEVGSQFKGLVVEYVIGGLPLQEDIKKFKNRKVHIVVGSPGRLRYLIQDKHIDISSVRLLVLDEADKLVDKSFLADVNYIFSVLPPFKQVIMSSATYPSSTKDIISRYMRNPQHVCPNSSSILRGVQQKITIVQYNSNIINQTKIRYKELINIFTNKQFKQCLIFCNYQVRVSELYKLLIKDNWPAEQLYGSQEQSDRLDAIKTLKEFKCRILIATDLAARGIDASNIDLVISFEPAWEWTTYLHRIGRAGRYGSYGEAITILSKGEEISEFEKMIANVMADSWDVYHLWSNEKFNSGNVCENKLEHVKNDTIDLLMNLEKDVTSKVAKEILDVSRSQGICEIENFDELLISFENNHVDNCTDTTFNKIELNNVEEIVDKLLSNNNNNFNDKKSNKINNVNGNLHSDTNKEPEVDANNIDIINDESSTDSSEEDDLTENLDNDQNINCMLSLQNNSDTMAELGLPASFSSKEDRFKQKRSYQYNKPESRSKDQIKNKPCYEKQNYNNYKETKSNSQFKRHGEVSSKEKKSHRTTSHSKKHLKTTCTHENNTEYFKNNYYQKKSKQNISNFQSYNKWYNELKYMSKQIEYMVYINEMAK